MTMRVMNILCLLTVVLAVAAMVFSLINAGGFDWKPLWKGATLIIIALGARWTVARQKAQRRPFEGQPAPNQPGL